MIYRRTSRPMCCAIALPVLHRMQGTRADYRQLARPQDPQHHQQAVHSADVVLLAAADAVANATLEADGRYCV